MYTISNLFLYSECSLRTWMCGVDKFKVQGTSTLYNVRASTRLAPLFSCAISTNLLVSAFYKFHSYLQPVQYGGLFTSSKGGSLIFFKNYLILCYLCSLWNTWKTSENDPAPKTCTICQEVSRYYTQGECTKPVHRYVCTHSYNNYVQC